MRALRLALLLLLATVFAFAQSTSPSKPGPGFSIDNIDKSIDPCVDFYQYACGNWIKNSEIPADRAAWQSFSELNESNLEIEHKILEKAAAGGPGRNAIDQKIGDLYGSCMDEKAADGKGLAPLKPELDRIAAVKDKAGMIEEIAHIHLVGPNPLFNFYSNSDLHNADKVIAYIDQGGMSLPDRDYYIKDDSEDGGDAQASGGVRDHTVHSGRPDAAAGGDFREDGAEHGDRAGEGFHGSDHAPRSEKPRPQDDARRRRVALAPNFYLTRYFTAMGAPNFTELNVANPDFFKQVNGVLARSPGRAEDLREMARTARCGSLAFDSRLWSEFQNAAGR